MITDTRTKNQDLPDYFYLKIILDFETLRKEVIKCKFKGNKEYKRKRKKNWAGNPEVFYAKEWKGWCHFLGKEERFKQWPDFESLRKEVIKLKLKSIEQYKEKRKKNWPYCPNRTYKKSWKGWEDFLGK